MADFLNSLFKNKTGSEYVEIRLKNASTGRFTSHYFSDVEQARDFALSHQDTHDVYVGVNPRFKQANDASAVRRTWLIWADIDNKKARFDPQAAVRNLRLRFLLPPNIIVSSGNGLHIYWFTETHTNLLGAQKVCNDVADLIGGDNVGDAPRILRVAGTKNHKYSPPKDVQLIGIDTDYEYPFEDVVRATKVPQEVIKLVYTGSADEFGGDRSKRDFFVVRALLSAGLSDETIKYLYDTQAVGDRHREDSERTKPYRYLDLTISKVKESGVVTQEELDNEWGIFERDDCYFVVGQEGQLVQLSTFTYDPHVLLEGNRETGEPDTLIGTVRSNGKMWNDVPLDKHAFNRSDSLQKQLPKVEWQWLGSDYHVKRLLPFLIWKLKEKGGGVIPTQRATQIIGRHGAHFVSPGQTLGIDDSIVWLPSGKEHPDVGYPQDSAAAIRNLKKFNSIYFQINEPHVLWLSLGWFVAALFKPVYESKGFRFPVLNLFGTRGSGKTTILTKVLQPLVGYIEGRTYDANTTGFVMLSLLGSTNAIPVAFSEYRAHGLRSGNKLIRYILLSYDSGYDSRGRPDQTTVKYPLCAPFTVDGEDAITDAACLERIIQVNLRPETIREGTLCYEAFDELMDVDIHSISGLLVNWTLEHRPEIQAAYEKTKELFPMAIPDRVRKNLSVVLSGIELWRKFSEEMGAECPEPDLQWVLKPALEAVVNVETGRTSLLADEFVESVISHCAIRPDHQDFYWEFEDGSKTFYFHLTSAYDWWLVQRNKQNREVLESAAIKRQLKERQVKDGSIPNKDEYLVFVGNRNNFWCYGVSLLTLRKMGLDVPEHINTAAKISQFNFKT